MKTYLFILLTFLSSSSFAQQQFITIKGTKANYSIEVPKSYSQKSSIGKNVDLKYADYNGSSIVTVVKNLPSGVGDEQIKVLPLQPDYMFIEDLEADGMENVVIIKRGLKTINGVQSYYAYYNCIQNGTTIYNHTITQFKKGKLINLALTCSQAEKPSYMAIINRVANSLK